VSLQRHLIEPHAEASPLICGVMPERDGVRVSLVGSLDCATAAVLEQQLEELLDAGFRRLIIDLGRLSFMDSTGLRLALRWNAAARADGWEIGFLPGSPVIQRVFEVTGTTDAVPFIRA
jgi:anti-sigma B factor antagonist